MSPFSYPKYAKTTVIVRSIILVLCTLCMFLCSSSLLKTLIPIIIALLLIPVLFAVFGAIMARKGHTDIFDERDQSLRNKAAYKSLTYISLFILLFLLISFVAILFISSTVSVNSGITKMLMIIFLLFGLQVSLLVKLIPDTLYLYYDKKDDGIF